MESRRGFLSQCLGGLAVGLAGAPALKAAGTSSIFDPPVSGKLKTGLRVETDLTPNGTSFLLDNGQRLWLINELLVSFWPPGLPHSNLPPWVGIGFIVAENWVGSKPDDRALMALKAGGGVFPGLVVDDVPLPVEIHQLTHDPEACLTSGFACGCLPVKLTKSLADYQLSFLWCKRCGCGEQCVSAEAARDWEVVPSKQCQKCGCQGLVKVEYNDPALIHKVYMTPGTSHLVFYDHPDCVRPEAPQRSPVAFDIAHRQLWLAKEFDRSPIAQLVPTPSPLNSFFMRTWMPLCG